MVQCTFLASESVARVETWKMHGKYLILGCLILQVCGTEHVTVREMHEHEMNHTKWQQSMMSCDICQRNFGTRHSLKGHMLRHLHGSFCCYLCGQQCHTQQQLQAHLARHKKSQFACFCGQRFGKKTELQSHQRSNIWYLLLSCTVLFFKSYYFYFIIRNLKHTYMPCF